MAGEAGRADPGRADRHTPDDIAGIVAFLASPDAAYISGQVIYACGGRGVAP